MTILVISDSTAQPKLANRRSVISSFHGQPLKDWRPIWSKRGLTNLKLSMQRLASPHVRSPNHTRTTNRSDQNQQARANDPARACVNPMVQQTLVVACASAAATATTGFRTYPGGG
ncbi:Os03g0241400 [Oryza sativa Japonica Group]|uniref:Os03g0241400 protein n=1 Tax=Oryza sativa subsp. japonica TaxID=39947 RepID=A0A0P0VVL0_ORYSJ|nr:hypothetical protein EE612_016412 [Oryza sativa]BAS83197.1 Os03g0241400 [Oryza sativa Japonica Group]